LLEPDSDEAPSSASVFHAAGTLPIGTVLGAGGAVPGAPGYYVMDASALPSLPACGPWLTVAAAARLWASHAEAPS
jgi:choline dehydrogenase